MSAVPYAMEASPKMIVKQSTMQSYLRARDNLNNPIAASAIDGALCLLASGVEALETSDGAPHVNTTIDAIRYRLADIAMDLSAIVGKLRPDNDSAALLSIFRAAGMTS